MVIGEVTLAPFPVVDTQTDPAALDPSVGGGVVGAGGNGCGPASASVTVGQVCAAGAGAPPPDPDPELTVEE
jgi:hypothetical protein